MAKDKNSVSVELYDLAITERKDDRCGKVVSSASLTENDLINIAVSRRTDLNPATLRATMEILREIAIEEITAGNSVCFGLAHHGLEVKGVFIGDHAKWDSKQHSLALRTVPVADLRNAVKSVSVNLRGMASAGTVINSVADVSTGEVNSVITAGGAVNLSGNKIKIAGDSPEIGIRLVRLDTQETVAVPANSVPVNEPSKITFVVPANLPAGDYQLSVTTQFSQSSVLLKEPRTYVFEYVLTCN